MDRLIFGHSFAELVALILLSGLAFYFLNKKKASVRGNAEDANTGVFGSMTAPIETNSDGSSSSPPKTDNAASSSSPIETNNGASSSLTTDNDDLLQGENIRPELLAAITKMKPVDVRYQTGSFGDAFHVHERRLRERSSFDPTILRKWKKALDEVSTLKGYEADGYEGELVKSVVRKALSELKKKFELVISENLVGIDSHVKKVMEFMDDKSHATLFVGIHGMGGIGKTTLAKAIYNKISNQFEHRSFIADIRESWKRNGAHYLQKQLIHDILNPKNEVRNEDEGTWFISSKFKGK
ncbi:hypothetical protein NL676_023791 [Syzygium grande]|nr:hypothetical protein NL676_023791 [Syzygium grande]